MYRGYASLAEGVDTGWRKFPYPFCAEDVRTLRSGVVCAPKVRLNGIKAVVSKLSYTEVCCTEALSLLAGEYRSTAVVGDTEIPTCVDGFSPRQVLNTASRRNLNHRRTDAEAAVRRGLGIPRCQIG